MLQSLQGYVSQFREHGGNGALQEGKNQFASEIRKALKRRLKIITVGSVKARIEINANA